MSVSLLQLKSGYLPLVSRGPESLFGTGTIKLAEYNILYWVRICCNPVPTVLCTPGHIPALTNVGVAIISNAKATKKVKLSHGQLFVIMSEIVELDRAAYRGDTSNLDGRLGRIQKCVMMNVDGPTGMVVIGVIGRPVHVKSVGDPVRNHQVVTSFVTVLIPAFPSNSVTVVLELVTNYARIRSSSYHYAIAPPSVIIMDVVMMNISVIRRSEIHSRLGPA